MDDINRSISEYVKNGKYYKDARAWYLNTFILPISEKYYLFVLTVFYIILMLIAGYYYSNTKPADPTVDYVLFSEDISKTYSVIVPPTSDDTLPPQTRLTQYVLGKYITIRESYDIHNLDNQLEFVRNTTDARDFLVYQNSVSINNPTSPQMIYQDLYNKTIDVHKINILKNLNVDNSQKAIVYFQSNLTNLTTNEIKTQYFVATIDFKIDNIQNLMEKDSSKMNFLVLNYNLQTIERN